MLDVLIRGDQNIESCVFRCLEKFAVLQLWRPFHFYDGADFVFGQDGTHADRNVMVEQDAQCDGSWRMPESLELDRAALGTALKPLVRSSRGRSCRRRR